MWRGNDMQAKISFGMNIFHFNEISVDVGVYSDLIIVTTDLEQYTSFPRILKMHYLVWLNVLNGL